MCNWCYNLKHAMATGHRVRGLSVQNERQRLYTIEGEDAYDYGWTGANPTVIQNNLPQDRWYLWACKDLVTTKECVMIT